MASTGTRGAATAELERFRYVSESLDKMSGAIQNILSTKYSCSRPEEQQIALDLLMNKLETIRNITFPLRFHRNHLSQIHLLSDEILIIIFRYWWDERIENYRGYAMGKQLLLSWVCQRWRILINNNPEFWINIDNRAPVDILRIAVQRSKNAGLHVKLSYLAQNFKEENLFSDIIRGQAYRIETWETLNSRKRFWTHIVDNLEMATCRLRYITFAWRNMDIELKSCPGTNIDLKPFITMLGSPAPWSAFNGNAFMSTIQWLRLAERDRDARNNHPDFNLDFNQCSRLQILDLDLNAGRYVENPFKNLTFTTLEQLHTLVFHRGCDLIILSYVHLPKLRRLVCHLDPLSLSDLLIIKTHIPFSRIRRLGIGTSHEWDDDDDEVRVQIDGASEDSDNALSCCGIGFAYGNSLSQEHQSNSRFQFCFKFEASLHSSTDDLLVIFNNILAEAANVDQIIIRRFGLPRYDGDAFKNFFTNRRCSSLTIQNIQNMPNILKKLCDDNICCGLQELALSWVSDTIENEAFGEEIINVVKSRQRKGSPMKRIHIKNSSFFPENVATGLANLGVEFAETIYILADSPDECECPCYGCLQEKWPHQWIPEEFGYLVSAM